MDYDVIIVGARIAGSTLAIILGQHGHRVLLVDKAHFPSDTLSTHFFREPALTVFERLGVLNDVKSSAPPLSILWNYIEGQVLRVPVKSTDENLRYFLCVRRITLDGILTRRVKREQGVEFRQGAQFKELIWQDGRVTGARWMESNGSHEAQAPVVVGADGFYSTLAKIVQPVTESQLPVQRFAYYTYFQGIQPLDEIAYAEHHFMGNSLTYVFPTDANLTMVSVSLPISKFQSFKKEPLKRLRTHLESLPLRAPRLHGAEVVADVKGAGNIPCYQRIPYGPGWVLVGDSHQVLDPWSGMGIDHATTHASMLADSLHRVLTDSAPWASVMSEYHTQVRQWSEKTYRRTSTNAADFRPMTSAALPKRGLV